MLAAGAARVEIVSLTHGCALSGILQRLFTVLPYNVHIGAYIQITDQDICKETGLRLESVCIRSAYSFGHASSVTGLC